MIFGGTRRRGLLYFRVKERSERVRANSSTLDQANCPERGNTAPLLPFGLSSPTRNRGQSSYHARQTRVRYFMLIVAHSLISKGGHYRLRSPRGARNSALAHYARVYLVFRRRSALKERAAFQAAASPPVKVWLSGALFRLRKKCSACLRTLRISFARPAFRSIPGGLALILACGRELSCRRLAKGSVTRTSNSTPPP